MSYLQDDEILGKAYDHRLMRRLLTYVKPYLGRAAIGFGLTIAATVLIISGPFIVGTFIDLVLRQSPESRGLSGWAYDLLTPLTASGGARPEEFIIFIVLALVFVELGKFVVDYLNSLLLQDLGQRILYDMRKQLFDHLLRQPMSFFHKQPVGRLVTRLANDIGALNELFSAGIISIFKDIFLVLGVGIAMMLMAWDLGLVSLAVVPLIVVVTFVFQHFIRKYYRNVRKVLSRINAYIAEQINGMREVQIFGREETNRARFGEINDEHKNWLVKTIRTHGFYRPSITILYSISLALVLWYGGLKHISQGDAVLTIGVLAAFIQLVQHLFRPIQDLAEKYNILQAAMASSERIFQLLDTAPTLNDPDKPRDAELEGNVRGRIGFEGVRFQYREGDPILKGVSFTVEPGEHVAIVGHTGAGKSTCINLLGRFYEADGGRVTLDGVPLRELTQGFIRKHIAIVHQDVVCFAGSIADNINLGETTIDRERIVTAARSVHASNFIEKLPKQYDAEVTEGGKTFSLGERQLLSFARALAFDPPILVLDEATANIDSHTEALIQDALRVLINNRTAIIIAHRLSTIKECDRIYVMRDGELIEQGTHEQLLAHGGHYKTLYDLQFADQESGALAAIEGDAETGAEATTTVTATAKPAAYVTAGEADSVTHSATKTGDKHTGKRLGPLLPDPRDQAIEEREAEREELVARAEHAVDCDTRRFRAPPSLPVTTHEPGNVPKEEEEEEEL